MPVQIHHGMYQRFILPVIVQPQNQLPQTELISYVHILELSPVLVFHMMIAS